MKKYLFPVLIIILGLLLASSLFHTGWFASHDGVYHILRTLEAKDMLRSGHFPLRWAGNLDEGFGIPLFTFIYPLPYYLTATLTLLGLDAISAVKAVMLGAYIGGALGFYMLFKKKNNFTAFVLAVLYLLTPYQFLNLFVRGALGEILALGLLPWVLVSFNDLKRNGELRWYHPLPLALLLTAHNFLGLIFTAFLILYILFVGLYSKKTGQSFLLSLALAAFFLIPMITERNLLFSYLNTDLNFNYSQHFVYLKQLLYGKWDYWYSLPGPDDGMSFQLGVANIALLALGLAGFAWRRQWSTEIIFLYGAYLAALFLMSARSLSVWNTFSILQVIQFPWRLLFMTTFLTILIGNKALESVKNTKVRNTFAVFLLVLAGLNVRNYRRPIQFLTASEYTDLYQLNLNHTTTTFRTEILPKWGPAVRRYKSDDVLVKSGNIVLENIVAKPNAITFTANNKEPIGVLTILRNYFPSWQVLVDDKADRAKLEPQDDGTMRLALLEGVHDYSIVVRSTEVEYFANSVTGIAILYLGKVARQARRRSKK